MNRYTPLFLILLFFLNACRQKISDSQLRAINESLIDANNIAKKANILGYEYLKDRFRNPVISKTASIWLPKAESIRLRTNKIIKLIDTLKGQLVKESDSLKKMNCELVKRLPESSGKGYELINDMFIFQDSIAVIFNPGEFIEQSYTFKTVTKDFATLSSTLPLLKNYSYPVPEKERAMYAKKWLESNFAGSSSLTAMLALNKIENDVLETENQLINLCIRYNPRYYDCVEYMGVAILSTSYVKSGQSVQVSAGIGTFKPGLNLHVFIAGKEIKLNSMDIAEYNFIAKGNPGKHKVPLKFVFTKPDGSTNTLLKNMEYVIAE